MDYIIVVWDEILGEIPDKGRDLGTSPAAGRERGQGAARTAAAALRAERLCLKASKGARPGGFDTNLLKMGGDII